MGFFDSLLGGIGDFLGIATDFVSGLDIPVVSPAAGAVSNYFNKEDAKAQHASDKKFNAQQAQLNREWQTSERIASQDFNMQMWNMNNEFNSTQNQLQRYMDAGGNPNTFFGGSSSAVAQPVTTSPGGPGAQGSTGDAFASQLLTSDAVIRNLTAQANLTDVSAEREQFGLSWDKLTAPVRLELLKANRDKIVAEIGKMTREIAHIDFDEQMQEQLFTLMANKNEAEIDVLVKQLDEIAARVRNYDADTAVKGAERELIETEITGNEYENVVKKARAEVAHVTGFPVDAPITNVLFTLAQEGRLSEMADLFLVQGMSNGGDWKSQLAHLTKVFGFAGSDRAFGSGYRWRRSRNGVVNPQR